MASLASASDQVSGKDGDDDGDVDEEVSGWFGNSKVYSDMVSRISAFQKWHCTNVICTRRIFTPNEVDGDVDGDDGDDAESVVVEAVDDCCWANKSA